MPDSWSVVKDRNLSLWPLRATKALSHVICSSWFRFCTSMIFIDVHDLLLPHEVGELGHWKLLLPSSSIGCGGSDPCYHGGLTFWATLGY
ncbi:hypothetical protein CRG98_026954 [Punica granatum]|uniref:Uncharacterized protein n=1 Tax=Punica granatum TaxID=22663 RepID=A0A2I0J8P0_PUNGR|nr:hypothetical protein CRG98_026954 [Punica granatum]